jgi:hypothetical protein
MSEVNKCPKCGAGMTSESDLVSIFACGSDLWKNEAGLVQSSRCRIAELENEVERMRGSVKELYGAMVAYEMSVEEPPPYKHRAMMRRASALLKGEKEGEGKICCVHGKEIFNTGKTKILYCEKCDEND